MWVYFLYVSLNMAMAKEIDFKDFEITKDNLDLVCEIITSYEGKNMAIIENNYEDAAKCRDIEKVSLDKLAKQTGYYLKNYQMLDVKKSIRDLKIKFLLDEPER